MTQQEQQRTSVMMMENVFASKTLPEIVVTDVLQDSLSFHLAEKVKRGGKATLSNTFMHTMYITNGIRSEKVHMVLFHI